MGFSDFLLGPIYILLAFFFASQLKNRLAKTTIQQNMYFKVLGFKLFLTTFFAFIYSYYYGGGDTFGFYIWSKNLLSHTFTNPGNSLNYFFTNDIDSFYKFKYRFGNNNYFYLAKYNSREMSFVKILSLINFLGMGSYLATSYVISFISFIANWLLYKVFVREYPAIEKKLIYSVMLVPSVCFWGGSILKDSITFICLCIFIYCVSNVFLEKKKIVRNLIFMIISMLIIINIRGFIVLATIPAVVVWLFSELGDKIQSTALRVIATPMFLILSTLVIAGLINVIGNELDRFSLNEMDQTIKDFQSWHEVASEGGSGYTLNVGGTSLFDMARAIPSAINVTFFRPYLWEISGAIVAFSAIESFIFSIYFLYVFFIKGKVINFFTALMREPLAQLSFIFSGLYGFSVGFTSYNFGALSRYKILAIPFFLTMLVIISYSISNPAHRKISSQKK